MIKTIIMFNVGGILGLWIGLGLGMREVNKTHLALQGCQRESQVKDERIIYDGYVYKMNQ